MNHPYYYVLAEGSYTGATIHPHYGVRVLLSRTGDVPRGIDGLLPERHSWEEHIQRQLNGESIDADPVGIEPDLRDYQVPRVEDIAAAHAAGQPGYVLAYATGLGKTYMAIAAMNRIKPRRVLVIVPKTYIAKWRETITKHSTSRTEWVVTNPERLVELYTLPGAGIPLHEIDYELRSEAAVKAGTPLERFDVVITDESHMLAHADRNRTRLWRRTVDWPVDGDDLSRWPTSFTLALSATGWTTPSETSSAAHIIAAAAGIPCPSESLIDTDYDGWLRARLHLTGTQDSRGRWYWADNQRDVARLTALLFEKGLGATKTRDELGQDSQQRRLELIELSPADHAKYQLAWTELLELLNIEHRDTTNPTDGRSRKQRLAQAAALIKAPYVAEVVADAVAYGYQVIVPAWLTHTVNTLQVEIDKALQRRFGQRAATRMWPLTLTGDTPAKERGKIIRTFQSGEASRVIITSIHESISLHAGQKGGGNDGADASDRPRITIFGDIIYGGKRAFQAEGRAARDGTVADVVYCCAVGTAEQAALAKVFRKLTNTRALNTTSSSTHTDAAILSFGALADELEALTPDDHLDDDYDFTEGLGE